MLKASYTYACGSPHKKAYALELLETLISHDLKALIFPLLEPETNPKKLHSLRDRFPQPRLGFEARIQNILCYSNKWVTTWTKCCVLYCVGLQQLHAFTDDVTPFAEEAEPIVREMALWTLQRLEAAYLQDHLSAFAHISYLMTPVRCIQEGTEWVPMLEKVIRLKSVDLFVNTPEYAPGGFGAVVGRRAFACPPPAV